MPNKYLNVITSLSNNMYLTVTFCVQTCILTCPFPDLYLAKRKKQVATIKVNYNSLLEQRTLNDLKL